MAKDPAFLFYSQDFYTGVSTMTFEDRGKYISILCLMHQTGRMNEETIRFVVGSVSDMLKSKFCIDEKGLWFNQRLETETQKRNSFTESRRNNGLKGGRPKEEKPIGLHKDKHKDNLMEDEDENENENKDVSKKEKYKPEYNLIWEQYEKKGSKAKAYVEWLKLPQEIKDALPERIRLYLLSKPERQYRKDLERYFTNETYESQESLELINGNNDAASEYTEAEIARAERIKRKFNY